MRAFFLSLILMAVSYIGRGQCEVNVFPNPSLDYINITLPEGDTISYMMFDSEGRLLSILQNQVSNRLYIDMRTFGGPIYDRTFLAVVSTNSCPPVSKKIILYKK